MYLANDEHPIFKRASAGKQSEKHEDFCAQWSIEVLAAPHKRWLNDGKDGGLTLNETYPIVMARLVVLAEGRGSARC